MKLLLDQGAPRLAASILRGLGLDATHKGEIGMSRADDGAILDRAAAEDRLVVTPDADFHRLLALARATRPSVIRVHIEGLKAPAFVDLVVEVLGVCRDEFERGAAVSVSEDGIRILRLPQGRFIYGFLGVRGSVRASPFRQVAAPKKLGRSLALPKAEDVAVLVRGQVGLDGFGALG